VTVVKIIHIADTKDFEVPKLDLPLVFLYEVVCYFMVPSFYQ
jgi:hypothetical protein